MRSTRLGLLAACSLAVSPAAAVTDADCARHRDELVAELSRNRAASVREIRQALEESSDAGERRLLEAELNEVWDYEERMRAVGDRVYRDCMDHTRAAAARD